VIVEIRRPGEDDVPAPGGKDAAPMVQAGGGGSVLRVTVRPLRKEDSAVALVVIEDVTQQRVADEARNSFVAQATHELRTPLTNMRLYLEMLLEDGGAEDAKKRADALNVISQEARRLERIVGDMLSVSEIEAGSMKLNRDDVRINTVFQEIEADFREQAAAKEIKLRFDLPPKMPVLMGDRDKIVMALHNLVGNAIKYTPAGGEVTVRVSEEKGNLTVDVTDNGIGIREDEREKIFEKFYRAKDRRITNITGTGLGLAIAREVVRMHGGDVTVRSQLDKGSTFTMTLPLRTAA
jgi:signal transduction histidine kinase